MKRIFIKHNGEKISNVIEYMNNYMNDANGQIKYEIFVGCDSQVNNRNTICELFILSVYLHKV